MISDLQLASLEGLDEQALRAALAGMGADLSTPHEEVDVPAFMSLGRPGIRPPNGYGWLLKSSQLDHADVLRDVNSYLELFAVHVELHDEDPMVKKYAAWLKSLTENLGLSWDPDLVGDVAYLRFRNVGKHIDGEIIANNSECFYVILQLSGSGWFDIQTDQGIESHRIEPGDLYQFDQRLDHSWRNDRGLCKAISLSLAAPAVAALREMRT